MQMTKKSKRSYTPPLVLQTEGLLLEQDLLTHSQGVMFVLDTSAQNVGNMDYSESYFEDYNYTWE